MEHKVLSPENHTTRRIVTMASFCVYFCTPDSFEDRHEACASLNARCP
jgi:hypothetical protein